MCSCLSMQGTSFQQYSLNGAASQLSEGMQRGHKLWVTCGLRVDSRPPVRGSFLRTAVLVKSLQCNQLSSSAHFWSDSIKPWQQWWIIKTFRKNKGDKMYRSFWCFPRCHKLQIKTCMLCVNMVSKQKIIKLVERRKRANLWDSLCSRHGLNYGWSFSFGSSSGSGESWQVLWSRFFILASYQFCIFIYFYR